MPTIIQHCVCDFKINLPAKFPLIQLSVTKPKEQVQCINYMFLKNKGLTMHLVCPQYHLLYIYMACLLTSSSLSLTYRAGLLNFETCFLREFRLLPTYFIHDKDIFKKSIIFIIPLPGFFLFLFFCFKKLRAVFPCKMRKLAFLSFQRK